MKLTARALVAGLLVTLAASAKIEVKAKADPQADLKQYKTFSWYPPRVLTKTGVVESDDRWIPLIKGIVREQLLAKGLKEVPSGGDMMVAVYGLRPPSAQLEAVLFPGGVNWGWGTPVTTGRYNIGGTLAVSLTDTKSKKPVWAGIASATLKDDMSDVDRQAKKAAAKMFAKYPKLP